MSLWINRDVYNSTGLAVSYDHLKIAEHTNDHKTHSHFLFSIFLIIIAAVFIIDSRVDLFIR